MKRTTVGIAVLLAAGTALYFARCASPALDRALGFPLNSQVQTCSVK